MQEGFKTSMKKKTLNLDGKKRITLGKLIPKDTTFFEVQKRADGALILMPKSDLSNEEAWIYKDKKIFKSINKGLLNLKKGLVTKIGAEFWGDNSLKHIKYTHEFLKSLEKFSAKDDNFEEIKLQLKKLASSSAHRLENIKTKLGEDVYLSKFGKNYIFWTYTKLQEEITVLIMC